MVQAHKVSVLDHCAVNHRWTTYTGYIHKCYEFKMLNDKFETTRAAKESELFFVKDSPLSSPITLKTSFKH